MTSFFAAFQSAFAPEEVKTIIDAYDKACALLDDGGQPDIVNEIIAKKIIALAAQGERDPDKLCKGALAGFKRTNRL